ncbi:unnamed protein product [Blepharisma stoltei]|uniref:Cache domain-containing protein n=1 Tax=Blepharisma stoltei TaxID=1481888 RepID=A0AAU9ISE2_9CILI|nr:unnamed protein product [Blepharisma stoltei]
MCNMIKNFWAELISIAKSWPIRRQMLFCYIFSIAVILAMIITLVLLNTLLLLNQTVLQIDETRNTQSSSDLISLIYTGGAALAAEMSTTEIFLRMMNNMLIFSYHESTFALEDLKSLQFQEIPESSLQVYEDVYGNRNVSFEYSAYFPLGTVDQKMLNRSSTLSYLWSNIRYLANQTTIRYLMYFEDANFIIVYPGSELPEDYDPKNEVWYQSYAENDYNDVRTTAYNDTLGNGQSIASLVYSLVDNDGKKIGTMSVDIAILAMFKKLDLQYLGHGDVSIIYWNGDIFRSGEYGFWKYSYKSMDDIAYQNFWSDIQKNASGVNYLIENDNIYRVASTSLETTIDISDEESATEGRTWYYIIMLLVNEADIMIYKEDAKSKIKEQGSLFIGITLCCSLVTTILIIYLIHHQSRTITEPLQGIIDFTYKLNTAKKIDMDELNQLKEGDYQVERLVQAYKCLASNLINKKDEYETPVVNAQRAYPPNELHRPGRILWKDYIEKIPNN